MFKNQDALVLACSITLKIKKLFICLFTVSGNENFSVCYTNRGNKKRHFHIPTSNSHPSHFTPQFVRFAALSLTCPAYSKQLCTTKK